MSLIWKNSVQTEFNLLIIAAGLELFLYWLTMESSLYQYNFIHSFIHHCPSGSNNKEVYDSMNILPSKSP